MGEGGGQVLRSSLTLSLLTQRPFTITNIRAGRPKPGLRPQHVAAVKAAQAVGQARVEGCNPGSERLEFNPDGIHAGEYRFDIGTAGSTSLVLQTVFLPLAFSGAPSRVVIEGGTHVPWSPTFEYLSRIWLPVMGSIGFSGSAHLIRAGYFPRGGGEVELRVHPAVISNGWNPERRDDLNEVTGISLSSNLPDHISRRQGDRMISRLQSAGLTVTIERAHLPSHGKGSALVIVEKTTPPLFGFSALGEEGKPAEQVADEAADDLLSFLGTTAVVDRYLADQVLVPLAIMEGTSAFTVERVTDHLITNAEIIRQFVDVQITIRPIEDGVSTVAIEPA